MKAKFKTHMHKISLSIKWSYHNSLKVKSSHGESTIFSYQRTFWRKDLIPDVSEATQTRNG